MTADTGSADAQGAEQQGQPQGGTPPAQGAPADQTAQGAGQAEGGQDRDSLQAKLDAVLADNRQLRQQRRDWEAQQQDQKPLAEQLDDLKAELAKERTQRQEQSLQAAAVAEASRLGFRNPDVAWRLLDRDAVQYDDDGRPTNVGKLLQAEAEANPYMVQATDFGAGNQGSTPGAKKDMNSIIRSAAGR